MSTKPQLRLGAFLPGAGQHVAAWRHPDAEPEHVFDFEYFKRLAQTAERGLFDAYFLADGLSTNFGGDSGGRRDRSTYFEPVTLFSALSTVTKHIGFIATASTTYEDPYLLARKFASLDHLSPRRSGWNVATPPAHPTPPCDPPVWGAGEAPRRGPPRAGRVGWEGRPRNRGRNRGKLRPRATGRGCGPL